MIVISSKSMPPRKTGVDGGRFLKSTRPSGLTTILGFCEFKAPGKVPAPHQQLVLDELKAKGVWVFWVDNEEDFKREVMRRVKRE